MDSHNQQRTLSWGTSDFQGNLQDIKLLIPTATRGTDRRPPTLLSILGISGTDEILARPSIAVEPVKIDPDPFNVLIFRRTMTTSHQYPFAKPPGDESWKRCHREFFPEYNA
jgi:hypothetical protein